MVLAGCAYQTFVIISTYLFCHARFQIILRVLKATSSQKSPGNYPPASSIDRPWSAVSLRLAVGCRPIALKFPVRPNIGASLWITCCSCIKFFSKTHRHDHDALRFEINARQAASFRQLLRPVFAQP